MQSQWNIPASTVTKNMELQIKRAVKKTLRIMTSDMLLEINRRITRGRNADNQPFQPYSPATDRAKRKQGKSLRVNLQDTSSMINSLMIDDSGIDNLMLKIGVIGVDFNGISNAYKARRLDRHKNYYFLRWTRSYKNFIGKRKRLLQEFL